MKTHYKDYATMQNHRVVYLRYKEAKKSLCIDMYKVISVTRYRSSLIPFCLRLAVLSFDHCACELSKNSSAVAKHKQMGSNLIRTTLLTLQHDLEQGC